MKRYTDYEPETVGEEFMLLLGRVEALGSQDRRRHYGN